MNRYSNESKDLVFGQDDDVENGDDNDDDDGDDDNDLSRSGTTWVRTMKRILLANQQLAEVRFWQNFYVCRIKLKERRYDNEIYSDTSSTCPILTNSNDAEVS